MEQHLECRRPDMSWHFNIGIRPSAGGKPTPVQVLYRGDFDEHGHLRADVKPVECSSDDLCWTHANIDTDVVFWRFAIHEIDFIHQRAA